MLFVRVRAELILLYVYIWKVLFEANRRKEHQILNICCSVFNMCLQLSIIGSC